MKYINKISSIFCIACFAMLLFTGCEGGELYNVDSPSWLADSISSAKNQNQPKEEEEKLENMQEDVYDIGNAKFSAGWFTLGKTYIVPAGKKWNAQLKLTVNTDNKYYKNFYLVINRLEYGDDGLPVFTGGDDGNEIGVIRYDNDPTKNSEWNTNKANDINRSLVTANFTNSSGSDDVDESVQKMNGTVTITVNRAGGGILIKYSNGTLTKTYKQETPFPASSSDDGLCFRIGVDGSYVNMLTSNVEPVEGFTSASDKQPVSMVLNDVPATVTKGTSIEDAMAGVTATVTYEEDVVKEVPASELQIEAIPNMDEAGEKTLVVICNKTLKGEVAQKPITAYAKFNVVEEIAKLTVTKAPSTYYFYNSEAVSANRTMSVNMDDMEITATYTDGATSVMKADELSLSQKTVSAKAGTYPITISSANGKSVTVNIEVKESTVKTVTMTPTTLGAEDNSTAFWGAHADDVQVPATETVQVSFTNYTSGAGVYNNYLVILRSADKATEYCVVRADNFGWGGGYAACTATTSVTDQATWLSAMNGAECVAYITNCNNGTADIQVIVKGTDGVTYYQSYLGVNTVKQDDMNLSFTVDGSHLVFK